MSFGHIVLTAVVAWVAYFVFGGVVFMGVPALKREFQKYAHIYRPQEDMKKVMPFGMAATFVAILVLTHVYAMVHLQGSPVERGLIFGGLIGIFFDCVFVAHNYVNLNIGAKLSIHQAIAYFFEWVFVCVVMALVYGTPAG